MNGTVFITGCSRGIGLGLARVFARNGWNVWAGARNPDHSDLKQLSEETAAVVPLPVDVTEDASVVAAAAAIAGRGDSLDVLINNAAVFPGEGGEGLETLDLEWLDEAFAVNVTGVARVSRAFLPLLRLGTKPRIVNISSGAGSIAEKDSGRYYPYSISKAALNMLSRTMAAEFAGDGIIVVPISPGWVKTDMGGPNGELSVEESASSLFETIGGLTAEDSGCFLGRDGGTDEYTW